MKTIKEHPSQAELNALFNYNPETGVLTWKVKPKKGRVKIGDVAGTLNHGYLRVSIRNTLHQAHRIIWIMNNGEIPVGYQIDHINNNKLDNRLSNLRLATNSQNQMNISTRKNNKTGIKGLYEWIHRNGTRYWRCEVMITINGKRSQKKKLFRFTESTKESQKQLAIAWLERTRAELHGEFVNHGVTNYLGELK